jgi:hypothetical protein
VVTLFEGDGMTKPVRGGGGNKKGGFVGVPSGVHLHVVGGNTHVKIGSSNNPSDRKNVHLDNKKSITDAMDWLKEKSRPGVPGYNDTFEYLRTEAKGHGR